MMEPDFSSTTLAQGSCQYELCIEMTEILAKFSGVSGYRLTIVFVIFVPGLPPNFG